METLAELKNKDTSLIDAVKNFARKNGFDDKNINVTIINDKKAILRIIDADLPELKEAERTIYHGWRFDVFTFTCNTRTSGTLEYDDVLTDEYRFKCSE